jgi:DNA-binding LacI/PurR family transcriptional regulator
MDQSSKERDAATSADPDSAPSARVQPTQRDVAKLAKTSQAAVSRVLSGGAASRKLRDRVLKACDSLGYVLDMGARTLVRGSSNMVAVVVANIQNPFYPYILDRLTLRIQTSGFEVLLLNASGGRDIDELLPIVLQYKVRSAIIMTASLSSTMANRLTEHNIPTVMLNRYSTFGSSNSVACDNLAGGRLVAESFIKAGFRTFAYVGGAPSSSTNLDRRNGFMQRLAESGYQPQIALDGDFNHDWGYEAGTILRRFSDVQSIFCADDVIAMGVMDSLKEAGLSVPGDFAVVGFDDIPSAGWAAYSLSTVQQPVDQMIEATLKLLDEKPSAPVKEIRIPGKLLLRNSFSGVEASLPRGGSK